MLRQARPGEYFKRVVEGGGIHLVDAAAENAIRSDLVVGGLKQGRGMSLVDDMLLAKSVLACQEMGISTSRDFDVAVCNQVYREDYFDTDAKADRVIIANIGPVIRFKSELYRPLYRDCVDTALRIGAKIIVNAFTHAEWPTEWFDQEPYRLVGDMPLFKDNLGMRLHILAHEDYAAASHLPSVDPAPESAQAYWHRRNNKLAMA